MQVGTKIYMRFNHLSRLLLTLMMALLPVLLWGEEAVIHRLQFKSGRAVEGEIVLRNDEVVIVKDSRGARFQYPMSDILEITEVTNEPVADDAQTDDQASRRMTNVKRTSLGLHLAGGVASVGGKSGAAIAADVMLGANNLAGRRIFLGGQVGYRALIAGGKTLSIIPIDAVMELPLIAGVHAPMLGANIGYGIGVGGIRGGVNAGLSLAYRYHFSRTGSLHIGIQGELQQLSSVPHTVTVEPGQSFSTGTGQTAVMGMLTFGVLF